MEVSEGVTENGERGSDSAERSVSNVEKGQGSAAERTSERPNEEEWKISTHQLCIILSLTIVNLVVALDATVIVTALSSIVYDIGGDTTQGFWIGTSYLLASTVIMPPMASMSEIFGRPACLMASLAAFSLGSILCCVAGRASVLLGGRAVQGIGGGGIWVVSLLLLTDLVPLRHRPKWWTVISLGWALGLATGPLIGGAIGQYTTWRWVFYLNFPICGFGLIVTPLLLTVRPKVETIRQKLARVDWIGSALFTASLTTCLFALTAGGTQFPWSSATILAPLILGLAGMVAAGLWEEYGSSEPMLKISLFYDWSSVITYLGGFAQGLVMYGELYCVPFFALSVKQVTPVRAGVILLPVMLILIPSGAVAGALVSRLNDYRYLIWVGWALVALSGGLQLLWDATVSDAVWFVSLMVMGIGHGFVLNAQTFACQALAKPGDVAAAAATYGFARQLGTAVGVSVGSTTFQNVMALKLRWQGLSADIAYNAEEYMAELRKLPDDGAARRRIVDSYVFGFLGVWGVFLGIAGVVFLLSFLIRASVLDKAVESEHTLEHSRIARFSSRRDGRRPERGDGFNNNANNP